MGILKLFHDIQPERPLDETTRAVLVDAEVQS